MMDVKFEHFLKAPLPTLFTELGIVMVVKLEHFSKAQCPIIFTEFGIIVFLQPAIRVFVAVSIIALQLFLLSYLVLPSSIIIDVKPEQPEKAEPPILVTELGIVIDVKPEQLEKAPLPIIFTELGIIVFSQPLIRVFVAVSIIALQLLLLS